MILKLHFHESGKPVLINTDTIKSIMEGSLLNTTCITYINEKPIEVKETVEEIHAQWMNLWRD